MSLLTKEFLQPIIRRIHNDDTATVEEIKMGSIDVAGAHFLSSVDVCDVVVKSTKNKEGLVLHLFIKKPCAAEFTFAKGINLYAREAEIFNGVIPSLVEFCKSKKVEIDLCVPICYFASGEGDKSCLILEDLTFQDYKMIKYDLKNLMDLEHFKLVITTLAKFHAVSYATRDTVDFPNKYKVSLQEVIFTGPDNKIMAYKKNMFEKVLPLFEESSKIRKNLEKYCERGFSYMGTNYTPKDKFNVVCHGDYWNNNFLFKYDKSNKCRCNAPIGIKILDFQGTRFNSLALDLNYLFYTTVSAEFRQKYLNDMLQLYYDEFSTIVKKLGKCCPGFTFAELCEEYRLKRLYGYSTLPQFLVIGLQSKSDQVDLDASNAPALDDVFAKSIKAIMDNPEKKKIMVDSLTAGYNEIEDFVNTL